MRLYIIAVPTAGIAFGASAYCAAPVWHGVISDNLAKPDVITR